MSGENAPAFTLPKMAVAAWRSAFIALKPVSNRRRARRKRSGGDAGANGAVTSATCRAHQDTPQPRNVATSPVIQQLTKRWCKTRRNARRNSRNSRRSAAVAGTDQSVAAGEARTAGRLATYASEDLHAIAPTQPRVQHSQLARNLN